MADANEPAGPNWFVRRWDEARSGGAAARAALTAWVRVFRQDLGRLWSPDPSAPDTIPRPDTNTTPATPSSYPPIEHLTPLLSEVKDRLKAQSGELDLIERKATTVLAANGLLLGLVVNGAARFSRGGLATVLLALALLGLIVALIFGVLVLWPEPQRTAPDAEHLLETSYSPPTNRMLAAVIVSVVAAIAQNRESGLSQRRQRLLKEQFRALVCGGLLVFLAFVASSLPILNK